MTARRSSSDPVSRHLERGEHVVWRHQPEPRALILNRVPALVIVVMMTCFVASVGWHTIANMMPRGPIVVDLWLAITVAAALFFLALLFFFLRFAWDHIANLRDSWNTHYALTDRRFVVVSRRGIVSYPPSYFHKMEALNGAAGAQVLLFDWGPSRKGRSNYRERVAGLRDANKLERLIRDTLRA